MIRGVHAMIFTPEAAATRAFLRDKVQLPGTDVGDGWLIFDVPEGEIGCHPEERSFHELSLYSDDIETDVATLTERGVAFAGPIEDRGWGRATEMLLPGGAKLTLYEPRYEKKPSTPS